MQNAEAGASADCSRSARDSVPTIVVQTTLHYKAIGALDEASAFPFNICENNQLGVRIELSYIKPPFLSISHSQLLRLL